MTTLHYADGQATGTDPTNWKYFPAVRDWFAALAPGARVAWTDHTLNCGPWVLSYADVVVPDIEDVAPINWLWTLDIASDPEEPAEPEEPADPEEPSEWCLVIQPDLTLWELSVGGLRTYVSESRPEEVSVEEVARAREELERSGREEWQRVQAVSHELLNRVQREWVARHCGRWDVTFEFREELVGRFARTLLSRMADLEDPHGWAYAMNGEGVDCWSVVPIHGGTELPNPLVVLVDVERCFVDGTPALAGRSSSSACELLEYLRGCTVAELWLDVDLGPEDTSWPVVTLLEESAHEGRPFDVVRVYVHAVNPSEAAVVRTRLRRAGYEVETFAPRDRLAEGAWRGSETEPG